MNDFEDDFPALQSDLRSLYDADLPIPPAVSDRILNRARASLARPTATRRVLRWTAAAAVAAMVIVLVRVNRPVREAGPQVVSIAGDVDGNGRVDILDALVLSRRIESNQSIDSASVDLNHDGLIDRHDVDSVAQLAVRLDRGGVR